MGIAPYGMTIERPCVGAGFYPARLSLRHGFAVTPPSQREALEGRLTAGGRGIPRLRARRGDEGIAPYGTTAGNLCVGAGLCPARFLQSLRHGFAVAYLSLRRPAGDTSLSEGGKGFRACGRGLFSFPLPCIDRYGILYDGII